MGNGGNQQAKTRPHVGAHQGAAIMLWRERMLRLGSCDDGSPMGEPSIHDSEVVGGPLSGVHRKTFARSELYRF
jgi:hypothetical protein